MAGVTVRCGGAGDLPRVAEIQAASPEAAQWDPREYLRHHFTIALWDGQIAGFVVARQVGAEESEILNLAVDPQWRRRGIGRSLVSEIRVRFPGALFLEVRESNRAAREFYQHFGFQEVASRPGYYNEPPGDAIVMKFLSC